MQNYSFSALDPLHTPKLQFINNLRALAILLVIFHHAGELFPDASVFRLFSQWGKCGVQLFFVMSAFTLCYTGSKLTLQPKDLAGFYIKRLFRIAPMYYLAIVGYYYLSYITNHSGIWHLEDLAGYTKSNILLNILFLHGFSPAANNSVVPGGWSIGCEMLFYILFPFILSLTKISRVYLLPVQIISWLAVGGLLFVAKLKGHHGLGGEASFAFYFIANQMSLFIWGILLFYYWQSKTFFKILIWGSIIGAIVITVFNYSGLSAWAWTILPSVIGVISCLVAKLFSKVHLNKVFSIIGEVSYSMYISHFTFLFIVIEILSITKFKPESNLTALLVFVVVTLLTFQFSKLTYRFIETPFINLGKKYAKMISAVRDNKPQPEPVNVSGS
jgi:peptidoglycan/LPS O-acetylase OafA/YrhL